MKKLTNVQRENLFGYIFILPWIIGFIIFGAYPIIYSFILSLNDVTITASGIETSFVGFSNYVKAFTTDASMIEALSSFLKNNLFMVIIINVFSVLFAVILAGDIKAKGFFRTIFFLPVIVVSGPVMAELIDKKVITMTNISSYSVVNLIYTTFGTNVSDFIVNMFSNLIYMFWFSGVQLIVYLTVLQRLDKSMYESAEMDGASGWQSFWKITLPSIKSVIMLNLIYTLILLATFDNNSVILNIKQAMFDPAKGFGFASSLAWIYFVVLAFIIFIVLILFSLKSKKKHSGIHNKEIYSYSTMRYERKHDFIHSNKQIKKVKKVLLGRNTSDGALTKIFVYLLLAVMSFAFLYPFIYMLLKSLQNSKDILSPTVGLIPRSLYFTNFIKAGKVLGFWNSLLQSIIYAGIPTLCQLISCSLIGYGLARFSFKGKKVVVSLIIASFIIPPQILMIPNYVMFSNFGLLGSITTFAIPAFLGQGIKSTIFIMLFYQSFNMIPKEYDEAAELDGASKFRVFIKIAIPLSKSMFVVAFLFSFVWYWNETYLTSLYIPGANTLPSQLGVFAQSFRELYANTGSGVAGQYQDQLNEAIYMAGTLISIIPLMILYFIMQRSFTKGIENSGLTGQ